MTAADQQFQRLMQDARRDPEIVGLVLTGSRGKGWATQHSDYDLILVVSDEALDRDRRRYARESGRALDLRVKSLSEFAGYAAWGSEFDWDRYSFAHVTALVDKSGQIQPMIDDKGAVPGEHRTSLVREALDSYINLLYRSLNCGHNGNWLGARLEAADSLQYLLTLVFALDGRHRPYSSYLERELRTRPLTTFPVDTDEFLALVGTIMDSADIPAQQRLLDAVEEICRPAGYGDVLDAWGADYDWMKRYRPV